MRTLSVDLARGAYPILIADGLLGRGDEMARHLPAPVAVVTSETVRPLYAEALAARLGDACAGVCALPDGERHKTLESVTAVHTWLLERGLGRDATLLAVGGGMIGDIAGFAAATYMRGVDFVQAPTTLLAQVDAAIGGKTGVNHPLGKNMVGAFWQPRAVLIDPVTLASLPERELRAGVAEIIKYGLLGDAALFAWLEERIEALLAREPDALAHAIEASCACKARIVAADEREQGPRALLNLGHTFAHAIETEQGYAQWLHGEAVGCGMALAADLAVRMDWLAAADAERAIALIARAGLPVRLPDGLSAPALRAHMGRDKKNRAGQLRLVLLRGIGAAEVCAQADERLLAATLEGARR